MRQRKMEKNKWYVEECLINGKIAFIARKDMKLLTYPQLSYMYCANFCRRRHVVEQRVKELNQYEEEKREEKKRGRR